MKKAGGILYRVMSSILVVLLLLTGTCFAEGSLRAARITDFQGTVNVQKGGGEKQFPAFKGMSLAEGDSITTEKDSYVVLEIDDDKEIKIGENTQIGMSELKGSVQSGGDSTGISLWAGKLWTKIKKTLNIRSKYEIRTPTTVMGVRGTRFYASQDGGRTVIAVIEGKVYVVTYRSEEQPDGSVMEKAIEAFIDENRQVVIDETVQSQEDIVVFEATLESLDLFVLEQIMEDPEGISPELLKNIEEVIEQKRQEKKEKEEAEDRLTGPEASQHIVYEPEEEVVDEDDEDEDTGDEDKDADENNDEDEDEDDDDGEDEDDGDDQDPALPILLRIGSDIESIELYTGAENAVTLEILCSPGDAEISVSSDDSEVAAVDVVDGILTITGVSEGTCEITVAADKAGYISAEKTIDVRVQVKEPPVPASFMTAHPFQLRVGEGPKEVKLKLFGDTFLTGDENRLKSYTTLGGVLEGMDIPYIWKVYQAEEVCLTLYGPIETTGTGTITISGEALESGEPVTVAIDVIPEAQSLPVADIDYVTMHNYATGDDIVEVGYIYDGTVVRVYDSKDAVEELGEEMAVEGSARVYIPDGFPSSLTSVFISLTEPEFMEPDKYKSESSRIEVQIPMPVLRERYDFEADSSSYGYGKVRYIMTGEQRTAIEAATGKSISKVIAYTEYIKEKKIGLPDINDPRGVSVTNDVYSVDVVLPEGFYHYAIAVYDGNNEAIASYAIDDNFVVWGYSSSSPYATAIPYEAYAACLVDGISFTLELSQGTDPDNRGPLFNTDAIAGNITLDGVFKGMNMETDNISEYSITVRIAGNTEPGLGRIEVSADALTGETPFIVFINVKADN